MKHICRSRTTSCTPAPTFPSRRRTGAHSVQGNPRTGQVKPSYRGSQTPVQGTTPTPAGKNPRPYRRDSTSMPSRFSAVGRRRRGSYGDRPCDVPCFLGGQTLWKKWRLTIFRKVVKIFYNSFTNFLQSFYNSFTTQNGGSAIFPPVGAQAPRKGNTWQDRQG